VFFGFRYFEKKNLYFPLRAIEATPEDIHLDYEDFSIKTKDRVQITGWFIPATRPRATVLFCHGNGGNISHRLEKIKLLNNLSVDVLIFDYRGYGMSTGRPSEHGLYLDAEAAYAYLVTNKQVHPEKIIVFGESLGGAVAVDLATKHKTGGIIIEGMFTSVQAMAQRYLPFIPSFIISSRFDSLQKIKHVTSPALLFHSIEDEIVPFEFGTQLFNAAKEPKKFIELRGGHNDAFLYLKSPLKRSCTGFFSSNLLPSPSPPSFLNRSFKSS
jgi:fermentation-respiration switch protein FrsA (DUF1100 family)